MDDDDGKPSNNIHADLVRTLRLIHSERHLVACDLLTSVKKRFDEIKLTHEDHRERNERRNKENDSEREESLEEGEIHIQKSFRQHLSLGRKRISSKAVASSSKRDIVDEEAKMLLAALQLFEENKQELELLEQRAILFRRALEDQREDGWIFSQKFLGISTHYRREIDDTLTVKLEGELNDVPLFEQLAVLREVDLYHTWAPFCSASHTIKKIGKIDMVGWFMTGAERFGLSRDACFRAIGCDSLRENGKIILVAEGIQDKKERSKIKKKKLDSSNVYDSFDAPASSQCDDNNQKFQALDDSSHYSSYLSKDPIIDSLRIPPVPSNFTSGRMTLRKFEAIIDVISPNSARTRIVTNINPNILFIPQSLISFIMRKMCGVLLHHLQKAAKNAASTPLNSLHAKCIRDDKEFYKDWLYPKFEQYCGMMGWVVPVIMAFDANYDELEDATEISVTSPPPRQDESKESSDLKLSPDSNRNPDSLQIHPYEASTTQDRTPFSFYESKLIGHIRRRLSNSVIEKKEHKVALSRQVESERLRPVSFTTEQLCRLESLREVKEKISLEHPKSENLVSEKTEMKSIALDSLLDLLTGVHSYYSHSSAIFAFIILLFSIFYAAPRKPSSSSGAIAPFSLLHWVGRIFQLLAYVSIYFILVSRVLVALFDNIDLPSKESISNAKALATARKLFARSSQVGSLRVSIIIIVLSVVSSIIVSVTRSICTSFNSLSHFKTCSTMTVSSRIAWDDLAVHYVQGLMSYTATFLVATLSIASLLVPSRKLKQ